MQTEPINKSSEQKDKALVCVQDFMVPTLADSRFFKNFLYQGGEKSTVSWIFENLKFKISEGYNQNWCYP